MDKLGKYLPELVVAVVVDGLTSSPLCPVQLRGALVEGALVGGPGTWGPCEAGIWAEAGVLGALVGADPGVCSTGPECPILEAGLALFWGLLSAARGGVGPEPLELEEHIFPEPMDDTPESEDTELTLEATELFDMLVLGMPLPGGLEDMIPALMLAILDKGLLEFVGKPEWWGIPTLGMCDECEGILDTPGMPEWGVEVLGMLILGMLEFGIFADDDMVECGIMGIPELLDMPPASDIELGIWFIELGTGDWDMELGIWLIGWEFDIWFIPG